MSSLLTRILLLALLTFIAAVVYLGGQRYDPGLIDFKATRGTAVPRAVLSSGGGQDERAFPPTEIMGSSLSERPREYTKENLYEHVDGHAEYFIGAGFAGLSVFEYSSATGHKDGPEIQVEVYDMGKPIQAFGVLVDESGENADPVDVGAMAFRTSAGVNFIKGRYYVKVSSFDRKAPLLKFAGVLADNMRDAKGAMSVLAGFPDLGKPGRTRFIKEGYRGLDFLHNVVEREYERAGKTVQVALLAGDERTSRNVVAAVMAYFAKSEIPYEKVGSSRHEAYKVSDKYEGDWLLIRGRERVFGVFGTADDKILRLFGE
jgi:hypothetical protein